MQENRKDIDFLCDCGEVLGMDFPAMENGTLRCECPRCHKVFTFSGETLEKLLKLRDLVQAIRTAEPIIGDCSIAVKAGETEVKVPYMLLLTRFNTLIKLPCDGGEKEFRLWIGSSKSLTLAQAAAMMKKG